MNRQGAATQPEVEAEFERELELAFAPLHKLAFGAAVGTVGALLMVGLTAAVLLTKRAAGFPLDLMGQYFTGYHVSPLGVLVGAGWGAFTGFVIGWFVAFCRNLVLAVAAFVIRARAELSQTRDFLDHI